MIFPFSFWLLLTGHLVLKFVRSKVEFFYVIRVLFLSWYYHCFVFLLSAKEVTNTYSVLSTIFKSEKLNPFFCSFKILCNSNCWLKLMNILLFMIDGLSCRMIVGGLHPHYFLLCVPNWKGKRIMVPYLPLNYVLYHHL